MTVHPSAQVDPSARIGAGVTIGAFCMVGPDVRLGEGVELLSHVVVTGRTTIGPRTRIFPFASIGHAPQDLKYRGEASTLAIGADCTIREGVTINPGTADGGMETRIGDRCLLMAHAHVGHDCHVGHGVVLSNNVMLAGHVSIGDRAILGGGVGVHQHVRIGEQAFVGGVSGLEGDLIPFGLAFGNRAQLAGLNLVGLRRSGVSRESIATLSRAFAEIFATDGVLKDRLAAVASSLEHDPLVAKLLAFLEGGAGRPLCKPAGPISATDVDAP